MADIEENKISLEVIEEKVTEVPTAPTETPKEVNDIAGNDISMLMKRFDLMEEKYLALSVPKPKPKRQPTEKQIKALENARLKKMENCAIRKELKEQKKKDNKQSIKEEVIEFKNKKSEPIVKDATDEVVNTPIHNEEQYPVYSRPNYHNPPPIDGVNTEFVSHRGQPDNIRKKRTAVFDNFL